MAALPAGVTKKNFDAFVDAWANAFIENATTRWWDADDETLNEMLEALVADAGVDFDDFDAVERIGSHLLKQAIRRATPRVIRAIKADLAEAATNGSTDS